MVETRDIICINGYYWERHKPNETLPTTEVYSERQVRAAGGDINRLRAGTESNCDSSYEYKGGDA